MCALCARALSLEVGQVAGQLAGVKADCSWANVRKRNIIENDLRLRKEVASDYMCQIVPEYVRTV